MVISKLFVWILSAKKFVYISAKTIFWQMSVLRCDMFLEKIWKLVFRDFNMSSLRLHIRKSLNINFKIHYVQNSCFFEVFKILPHIFHQNPPTRTGDIFNWISKKRVKSTENDVEKINKWSSLNFVWFHTIFDIQLMISPVSVDGFWWKIEIQLQPPSFFNVNEENRFVMPKKTDP
jgi:hypothetical protein